MELPMPDASRLDVEKPSTAEQRPFQVLVIAGSQRRLNSCPGLNSKARALMHRMLGRLPAGWQIDHEDIGNEHGKPKIQACNACVSSSMALCVWPCNCYGPNSDHQPDLLWNLDLYRRLARADAWAFIGPINWYGPSTNFKLLFDRLVCMNGGNPRPDLIDKKNTLLAQALERSPQWKELTRNHLEGRTAAFFCYGDQGGADFDEQAARRSCSTKRGSIPHGNHSGRSATPIRVLSGNAAARELRRRTSFGVMPISVWASSTRMTRRMT